MLELCFFISVLSRLVAGRSVAGITETHQTTLFKMDSKLAGFDHEGYGFLKPDTVPPLMIWCGFEAASSGICARPAILETAVE